MASFSPNREIFGQIKEKVVVLSGGANGIGAATVKLLQEHGAYVIFGDLDQSKGDALIHQLSAEQEPRVHFQKTDVTDYQSLLALFDLALKLYGRIDHAMPFAGIIEIGNWFEPSLDLDSIKQASKHGVLGLMRSLRTFLPSECGIRVNAICPWMTDTGMVSSFEARWKAAKIPVNTPLDIAKIALQIACERSVNGKSIYVEGGRGWEIEDNIDRLEPQWLGEEQSRSLAKGCELLGKGSTWIEGQDV